jgi:hypothetical protein
VRSGPSDLLCWPLPQESLKVAEPLAAAGRSIESVHAATRERGEGHGSGRQLVDGRRSSLNAAAHDQQARELPLGERERRAHSGPATKSVRLVVRDCSDDGADG